MKTIFDSHNLNDFRKASSLEWLETNGIGGYASSTVAGAHTRRYHGLLVAAMSPPVGRTVVVSKLDETIVQGEERFELSSNQYSGAVHPEGFKHLTKFERDLFPEFYYQAGGIELKKTIAAIHGENTTVIVYEVLSAKEKFTLELLPLYACRDFHSTAHANDSINQPYLFQDGLFRTVNYQGCPEVIISVPGSEFKESKGWYYNFEYAIEQYRGLDFKEDLYTHGKFVVELKKESKLGIIISTDDTTGKDALLLLEKERKRREAVVKDFTANDELKKLALAADQFIVKRGELKTIIAGYHWFADWGRDTMISLPGLCLTTGRFEDAKNILKAFANSVSEGMLPNRFPDQGEAPEYNTFDATLWYFHAIYKYYECTKDKEFVQSILPVLQDIIDWHYKGTRYNIHVDPSDELLYGGQDGVQLTWMDAKVGDWVVTPRKGKPVEINALWYNALSIMEFFLADQGNKKEADKYKMKARVVANSFNEKFWSEENGYLYDCIDGDFKDASIRPNQIYAISLPFSLLTKERATKVFKVVKDLLLTPKGLRSLNSSHPDYKPVYGGDPWHRDGAYHQGTVWSFQLGAYIDALMQVKGAKGKSEATSILKEFFKHLDEAGVGTVSEIFDAEPPHTPRGCMAQAWGVGEILRVAKEHELF
ncbi:MAG: amylo-alpha-1,6-glucosidase [Cyclobacteriaceae bacterium]